MGAAREGGPLKFKNLERISFFAAENAGAVDGLLFVADTDYELVQVDEVHNVAGTDAGAVTLDVKKATGTTAIASGTSMLASTFNLKSTACTVVRKTLSLPTTTTGLSTTADNRKLARDNRLGLDFTGTTTALVGVLVQVWLRRLRRRTWY